MMRELDLIRRIRQKSPFYGVNRWLDTMSQGVSSPKDIRILVYGGADCRQPPMANLISLSGLATMAFRFALCYRSCPSDSDHNEANPIRFDVNGSKRGMNSGSDGNPTGCP